MKNNKKLLIGGIAAAVVVVIIVVLALFGGGNTDGGQMDSFVLADGETYNGEYVEITFSHTMGENLRNVLDAYIAEFNKIYPNKIGRAHV